MPVLVTADVAGQSAQGYDGIRTPESAAGNPAQALIQGPA